MLVFFKNQDKVRVYSVYIHNKLYNYGGRSLNNETICFDVNKVLSCNHGNALFFHLYL